MSAPYICAGQVGRTAELARTFGIDFFAVLFRGSQYRVESMMARLAHTQNYLLPSPSKEQVRAPGCAPSCHMHAGRGQQADTGQLAWMSDFGQRYIHVHRNSALYKTIDVHSCGWRTTRSYSCPFTLRSRCAFPACALGLPPMCLP